MKNPYNKGDAYEYKIYDICQREKILPPNFKRAGASDKSDIKILHKNTEYNVEIKADKNGYIKIQINFIL